MAAQGGAPFRSGNAGELSPDAAGRNDIKQFYSGGLKFKNIEPVPLSGFRVMAGSIDAGIVRPRIAVLPVTGAVATPGPFTGTQIVWTGNISGKVVAVDCDGLLASAGIHMIYAEVLVGAIWKQLGAALTANTLPAEALTFAVKPNAGFVATQVRLVAVLSVSATIAVGIVTVITETAIQDAPRYASLRHDSGSRYALSLQAGFMDIYEDDVFVAGIYLSAVTTAILPLVTFYAENATLGIFHRDLQSLRVRRSGTSIEWVRDMWPYKGIPGVDLGLVYPKIDDVWEVNIKYTATPFVYLTFIVNGESTPGIPVVNVTDVIVTINLIDLPHTAAKIKTALEALPSLGASVTVTGAALSGTALKFMISFGGVLSGVEYQLVSSITNTSEAAALASHITIGKTDFEPLFSNTRGWAGVSGLLQDRLAYGDIKAINSAISISQAGEYFTLNIKASGDNAARLDNLRSPTASERVLAFAEATYFLILTDRAVHFAENRSIEATKPLNYIQTDNNGTVPTCEPVLNNEKVYYVGVNPKSNPPVGHKLMSMDYSAIATKFSARPEHIFAEHLVDLIIRDKAQLSSEKSDASRIWLMRSDGRLISANIIESQEVLGFCEWISAASGLVKEIHVDAGNDLRIAVLRGGTMRHERLDRATLFHATLTLKADLAGRIRGLEQFEGLEVWARSNDYILGPFTVQSASIDLGDAYDGDVQVGLWQAPVFQSMPRYYITRTDEIIKRPGRIHKVICNVLNTSSIAIGANGQPPEDVPLTTTNDPVDAAMADKSVAVSRNGMLGHQVGTTWVVTQKRPGTLHVRDSVIEEKL